MSKLALDTFTCIEIICTSMRHIYSSSCLNAPKNIIAHSANFAVAEAKTNRNSESAKAFAYCIWLPLGRL